MGEKNIEEARENIIAIHTELIGARIDADNEQANQECVDIGDELHPDFEVQHPEFFFQWDLPARPAVTSYKQIDLWDSKTIRERFRKLDPDQQYVADLYVKYARTLKLAQKGFCTFPDPPFLVIEGDG